MAQKLLIDIAPILATAVVKISSNYYDNISFQSSTLGSKSRKLQITKSGLSVFIHLKYTALEKLIEDRNISREISSQIQLAVGHASLGGRLGNFIFSHQNRLRQ